MSKIFKDVILFKGDNDKLIVASREELPVTLNFNQDIVLGITSNIRVKDGVVYGDIEIFDDKLKYLDAIKKSYPYIGARTTNMSYEIVDTSIGVHPGADPMLNKLGDYITADKN